MLAFRSTALLAPGFMRKNSAFHKVQHLAPQIKIQK
jgi:hypothetical protein